MITDSTLRTPAHFKLYNAPGAARGLNSVEHIFKICLHTQKPAVPGLNLRFMQFICVTERWGGATGARILG